MKKFTFPLLLGTLLLLTGCSQKYGVYQYPFKTAKIEYAISGTTEGKSTLLIKGDKSVREAHIIFHSPTGDENQNNLYIDTGEYVYSVDLDKKVAIKTPSPLYKAVSGVDVSKRDDLMKKLAVGISPEDVNNRELKSKGKETVAGQECENFSTGDFGKICLWNNIQIKTDISIPEKELTSKSIATSIQTNLDIPDSAFDLPAGITVQTENLSQQETGANQQ